MQTDIQATLEVMKSDIHGTLESMRTENAKRENRMILTVLGIMLAGITILGFVLN